MLPGRGRTVLARAAAAGAWCQLASLTAVPGFRILRPKNSGSSAQVAAVYNTPPPQFRATTIYKADAFVQQPYTATLAGEATGKTLRSVDEWQTEPLETALRSLAESKGVAAGKVFQPLRVALTGLTVSPGIFEVLMAMGKDLSLKRIADAVDWLKKQIG